MLNREKRVVQERRIHAMFVAAWRCVFCLMCMVVLLNNNAFAAPSGMGNYSNEKTTALQQSHVSAVDYCPPLNHLMKSHQYWRAPVSWRGYSKSFATQVVQFLGAQWVGVGLGHIICLYRGNGAFTFPIALQRDTLIPVPSGGRWVARKSGYWRCIAHQRFACPFPLQRHKTRVNIHRLLEGVKKKEQHDQPWLHLR